MPSSVKEELDKIQRRAVSGHFLATNTELDELLKSEELSLEEELYLKIFKSELIQALANMGFGEFSYEEGIRIAKEVVQNLESIEDEYLRVGAIMSLSMNYLVASVWEKAFETYEQCRHDFAKLEPNDGIFYLRLKANHYLFESMIPFLKTYINEPSTDEEKAKGFQLILECEKFCEQHKLVSYQIACLHNISTLHYWFGDLDAFLKSREKMVDLAKRTGNRLYYAYTLSMLATVYFTLNDFRKYYDIHKEILVIFEELEMKSMIARSYRNIGEYFLVIGDYDEAIDYYKQCIEILEELEKENGIAFLQKACGYAYFLKGDFGTALAFYDKAYPILEKNRPQTWRFILSDMAALFIQTGDYDRALDFLEKLMPIHEGLNDLHGISLVLSDQGMIYWQKGMKEKGLELIEKSLEMRRKLGDKAREAASLSYLIQFHIEQNNIREAEEYFESLDQINNEIDNKHVNQNHKFSEALLLKSSDNERDRIKSEFLLEQLIEEMPIYPVLVQVLLNLCELLLNNLRETNDPEMLKKIKKNVNKLQELSENNQSHILLVETLNLKAQLSLIDLDLDSAKSFLLQAQTIAQENGLEKLVLEILKQQENITKQSIELKKLEQEKSTISSKMTVVKLEDTVGDIKRSSLAKTVSRDEVSKKLFSIQI